MTTPVYAQEEQPGDVCIPSQAGWFKRSEMSPSSDGGNLMFCDGTNWMGIMRFTSGGNLGIWNPSPTAELDISGKGAMNSLSLKGVAGLSAPSTDFGASGLWSTGTGDSIYYNSGSPKVGIGITTPNVALDVSGDIEYTGVITDVSDRRSKTEITPLPIGQLKKITELQGVSFKMKNRLEAKSEFGLIAQDVQAIYPNLVYSDMNEMLSLNYVGLIAPIIEAIKEQEKIINGHNNMVKSLQTKIDIQNNEISELRERIEFLESN